MQVRELPDSKFEIVFPHLKSNVSLQDVFKGVIPVKVDYVDVSKATNAA